MLVSLTVVIATRSWQDHVWLGWLLAAATAAAWAPALVRGGAARWWFLYVFGIFVYALLRSYADETAIPVRVDYPIRVDRGIFLGGQPVVELQSWLFNPGGVGPLDWAAVAMHWSFFVVPHAAAVAIFLVRRRAFAAYVSLSVGTMWLGLLLFFLLPTAPPWLAAQYGEFDGVVRVMDFVGGRVDASTYETFHASLAEPNSVAAMPSIHLAVTFGLFLWCRWHARRWALPALAYTVVMGASLVYLAEHYVVDLVAGALVAFAVFALLRRSVLWGKPEPDKAAAL